MNTGPYGVWYLVLLLPALVLLGWWFYRFTVPDVTPGQRRLLLGLRVAALGALALALARPVFTWEKRNEMRPVWVRLVDYSASMDRPDADALGHTRLAAALSILDHDAWTSSGREADLETYYFADSVSPDSLGMVREGTDLEAALGALAARPNPPAAVLLLSDGTTNAATDPTAREWPFPIYSICLGDSGSATDRALLEIEAPATATAGDSVEVRIRLASTGEPSTALFTFRAGSAAQSRRVELGGGGRQQELVFRFRPDSSGVYKLTGNLPPLPDEVAEANNTIETRVYVEPRRRRALLLAESPNWETAFLARRMAALDRLTFEPRYRALAGRAGYSGWPATYDSLAAYDLIIVADLPPVLWANMSASFERYLRERGGGMLFCVGPVGAAGAWTERQTRMACVRWRAEPPGILPVSEPVHLTPAGRYHPVTRPDPEAGSAGDPWGDLPLLSGVVPSAGSVAGYGVGLVDIRIGASDWPVVVAGQIGRGRVLTLLGYPIWRWDFVQAGTPGKPVWAEPFWRAAALWLSTSREGERLTVLPAADPLPALAPPEFSAVLVDESWQPLTGATVIAEIRDSGDAVVQTFELEGGERGRYRGKGRPLPTGEYRYTVRARVDTNVVAMASGRLATSPVSREELWPGSRPLILDKLAAGTGGQRLTPETWPDMLEKFPRRPTLRLSLATLRLWESPWLLALILVLLGTEWILRRRFQML